ANTDCKKLLKSLPNPTPTLVEMMEACNRFGTSDHKYEVMAAAFATSQPFGQRQTAPRSPGPTPVCYGCGKAGHLQKNC
ncbi:GAK6 protein, partial [Bucco capensis]|nr:GAK6 protein [Bucco capensis]